MTARSATATLLRAVLRATAAVPAAATVCASADLFRIPQMLESDSLDPTTEKCVLLFQPIKRGLQLSDDCLGLIGNDDQFDIDPFV
jgi:hypothetical protein